MSTGMPESNNSDYIESPTQAGEQLAYNPPPPEAAEAPTPVMNAFRERGYDTTSFGSDQEFIQTLESGLAQVSEIPGLREELARQKQAAASQQYMPEMDTTPAPTYDTSDSHWTPPDYDPSWENLVTVDPDTGQYVPVNEHVNPEVAQRANEYRGWLKKQGRDFWNNPFDFMKGGLEGWVRDIVTDHVGAAVDQNNVDQNVDAFLSSNRDRFYITDMQGNIQYDPNTGAELLTPQGQTLKHHADEARQLGINEPNKIQAYALNMLERDLYANQANQQYYAQQPQPVQQQQTFLQQAAANPYDGWSPNRDGTVQTASEGGMAQNASLSFLDMAMPEMVNMGLVQQTG